MLLSLVHAALNDYGADSHCVALVDLCSSKYLKILNLKLVSLLVRHLYANVHEYRLMLAHATRTRDEYTHHRLARTDEHKSMFTLEKKVALHGCFQIVVCFRVN